MNLQSFCRRALVAVLALGAVGYTALAVWLPASAGGAASLPPMPAVAAAPEPPPVARVSVPSSVVPLVRPVHRAPEPRVGRSARAAAPGGARDHARTAAELATRVDQGYVPSRRIY